MRRTTGFVLGACATLVLVSAAGAAALRYTDDEGKLVGIWHEAPGVTRSPVAAVASASSAPQPQPTATVAPLGGRSQASGAPPGGLPKATASVAPRGLPEATASDAPLGRLPESTTADPDRQRVGALHPGKLLGYPTGKIYTEKFAYPGASYVKLHFNRLAMLPGDYLTVSNPAGTETYRYTAPSGGGSVNKWAMSITGDTAVLQVHRAGGKVPRGSRLGVDVDRVAKGFTRTEQQAEPQEQPRAPQRTGREESVCGADTSNDAVCFRSSDPVAYTRSKAVARLLINGTELCSAWRVGPNNRMLTNNHCFTDSAEAYDTEVWFNYQCTRCGGYDTLQPTKVWGDKVLSTDHVLDYTLFTVSNFAAVRKFGYLLLDTVRPVRGQQLYLPQHPAGEPTQISGSLGEKAGNCAVANPGYTGYATASDVSYYCDTQGGSSGSPVLSRRTNRVVALHHFGGCPNSGVRADLLAARLRKLL